MTIVHTIDNDYAMACASKINTSKNEYNFVINYFIKYNTSSVKNVCAPIKTYLRLSILFGKFLSKLEMFWLKKI